MRYFLEVYRGGSGYIFEEDWINAGELPYSPLLLERLAAVGAIAPRRGMLSQADAKKVEKVLRLRRSLGVNLSGAVIIAELMERLDAMEEMNRRG